MYRYLSYFFCYTIKHEGHAATTITYYYSPMHQSPQPQPILPLRLVLIQNEIRAVDRKPSWGGPGRRVFLANPLGGEGEKGELQLERNRNQLMERAGGRKARLAARGLVAIGADMTHHD